MAQSHDPEMAQFYVVKQFNRKWLVLRHNLPWFHYEVIKEFT